METWRCFQKYYSENGRFPSIRFVHCLQSLVCDSRILGDAFKNIIPRMGGFHSICTLPAIIGVRFKDTGRMNLCIESDVIAEGSVNGVLEEKRYNRTIRFHKLLYKALLRLAWKDFASWLEMNNHNQQPFIQNLIPKLEDLCQNLDQNSFIKLINCTQFIEVSELFNSYLNFLRNDNGSLSAFWMTYIRYG